MWWCERWRGYVNSQSTRRRLSPASRACNPFQDPCRWRIVIEWRSRQNPVGDQPRNVLLEPVLRKCRGPTISQQLCTGGVANCGPSLGCERTIGCLEADEIHPRLK